MNVEQTTPDTDGLTARERKNRILRSLGILAVAAAMSYAVDSLYRVFDHIPFAAPLIWLVTVAFVISLMVALYRTLGPVIRDWSEKSARKSTDRTIARLRGEGAFVAPEQRTPEQHAASAISRARRVRRRRIRNAFLFAAVLLVILALVL